MKTLYLHAGMHKTGSTSIQHYLGAHADFFSTQGIHVVRDMAPNVDAAPRSTPESNCFRLADCLIDKGRVTPARLRHKLGALSFSDKLSHANNVNAHLQALDAERLILSAEAFSFLRTWKERLLYRFMFRGLRVEPIIFFRDKTDWMTSWRAELSKGLSKGDANAIGNWNLFDFSSASWLLDYRAIEKFLGGYGHYLVYEKSIQEYGSVIPSILRILQLDLDDCPRWDSTWLNAR